VTKLRTGEMPPPGRPRPDADTYRAVASALERELDAAAAATPHPGRVPVHRLNRSDYTHAIRDLLALEVDGRALLSADEADQEGFDNVASVLVRFAGAARELPVGLRARISRLAVGDPGRHPVVDTFKISKALVQDDRLSDDLPFGSQGGALIRYHFPLDAEYTIKVLLRRQEYDYIIGMGERHQLDFRLDGVRIKRFTVGGDAKGMTTPGEFCGEHAGRSRVRRIHAHRRRPSRGARRGERPDFTRSACRSSADAGNRKACCNLRRPVSAARPTSTTKAIRPWRLS
jgi:hypothetical protein